MKTPTRVTSVALAAAVLAGLAAPAAVAHGAHGHHGRPAVPFTQAVVTAADDGSYTVSWAAPGVRKVTVKANGRVVARGDGHASVTVRGLPAADRQWFDLVPERGEGLRLADRLVKLQGTTNFRDAGGYRTADGRWVKMGEVYRSDALDKLTPADLAKLERLHIRTVFDLRTASERGQAPDRVPARARYEVADVLAGSPAFTQLPRTEAEAVAAMVEAEKFMVRGDSAKDAYTRVFDGIARADEHHAVLFHCTAGKDRTGWAGATLLNALGVPSDTVLDDYLASNTYRAAANKAVLDHLPAEQAKVYKPMLDVREEYLNAGYAQLSSDFGSFGAYLRKGIAVDARQRAELREELLTR
ncbi:tyrosine-protein phosphatase [Streptomyces sp. NPDC001941]|uniref:tyrosine-protein phosphatase n=1 Tax=Streptomyces sp. NPDC001941 TaxID=3154659 RepID=UPI00332C75A4